MLTLLIAENSAVLASTLQAELGKTYAVHTCADGPTALKALESLQPDMLILDLSLPVLDGLTVLEKASYVPPVILALAPVVTPYTQQAAADAGVGYIMMIPCAVSAVVSRLEEMVRIYLQENTLPDPQQTVAGYLDHLKLPRSRKGYRQLKVGVPLFAQDPGQSLHKELYPAILERCGGETPEQVESTIRAMVHDTWKAHTALWKAYFPDLDEPPSNGDVLRVLAKKLLRGEEP